MQSNNKNKFNYILHAATRETLQTQELGIKNRKIHCVKSVRIWSYSGPYFPVFNISPYSIRMRENADQYISEYGHFLRSDCGRVKKASINNNEERNTLILYCLHEIIDSGKSAVVNSNNTNVFVLLVSHATTLSYEQLHMKWGAGNVIGINEICERSHVPI